MNRDAAAPGEYEIVVEGWLDDRWSDWFGGLKIEPDARLTVIHGPLADQAALFGVLKKIQDLGLPLISLRRICVEPERDCDDE